MTVTYSVVVPIKDEEENIEDLVKELEPVMQSLNSPWELIYVDDGSSDKSPSILAKLSKTKPYLRTLTFKKNYGQTSAFDAGFKAAKGEFVITMDGDRQNDPADIPKLVQAVNDCDLVCGWRRDRHDPWTKRMQSAIANAVRRRVCQDDMHDTGCSLKIYRTACLKNIKLFHGMHRFLPALFKIEGFRTKEIPVNHRERVKGTTKYNFFSRLITPAVDMLAVSWMRRRRLQYKIDAESN